jgi:rhodanese-related sulfurtransferase
MGSIEQYWPLVCLVLWFSYKWWATKQVVRMIPELRKNGALFIDVRSVAEGTSGRAPGSINIPLPELSARMGELPKDSDIVLCCASGSRSDMAKLLLKTKGFDKFHKAGNRGNLC